MNAVPSIERVLGMYQLIVLAIPAAFCCGIERTYLTLSSSSPPSTPTLDECIKKARVMKGITQKELAAAIGTYEQAISNWEGYETLPRTNRGKVRHRPLETPRRSCRWGCSGPGSR